MKIKFYLLLLPLLLCTAASMVGVAKGNSTTPSTFISKSGTAAGANANYPAPFDFDARAFTGTVSGYVDNGNNLRMGNRNDGRGPGDFWSPEIVLFNSALSNTDKQTIKTSQKNYYLTSVPVVTAGNTASYTAGGGCSCS
jgi:hypothetical protein